MKEQGNGYNDMETNAKVEVVRVLLEHGADVTARDGTRSTPLHVASLTQSPQSARLLIEHGADVNAPDRNLKTPLHLALSWVSVKPAQLLLQYKADMKEQKNIYNDVVRNATVEVVRVLLERGADVAARDSTHSTPLHAASLTQSPQTARLLIEHGADVNVLDGSLNTPLHLASSSVSVKPAQLLVQYRLI